MPESDTDIRVYCPRCDKRVRVPVAHVGRVLKCPTCAASFTCPPVAKPTIAPADVPPPAPVAVVKVPAPDGGTVGTKSLETTRSGSPQLRTRYATGVTVSGKVVGLERVREQYVEGKGWLQGSFGLGGDYRGANGMHPAAGTCVAGGGNVRGESAVSTRYKYDTHFHVRGDDGIDRAVHVAGAEYLPVLEGHAVTAVYCRNDRGQDRLVAVVNHSAEPRVLTVATERELLDHLVIAETKEVRRTVVSPELRRRLREPAARVHRRARVRPGGAAAPD